MKPEAIRSLVHVGTKLTSEKDIDKLLTLILESAVNLMNAERSTVFVCSANGDRLVSKIALGVQTIQIDLGFGEGIAGCVAERKQLINIQDAYEDNRFNKIYDGLINYKTRNILCGPILYGNDKLLGVLQVLNKVGGTFDKDDEELLGMFSSFCAVALNNYFEVNDRINKERFEMIGKVAGSILHDISNPLTLVRGLSELIAQNSVENEIVDYAQKIVGESTRLNNMIREFYDFVSGGKNDTLSKLSLGGFLRHLVEPMKKNYQNKPIIFEVEVEECEIFLDIGKMERVMTNLLYNSISAMNESGRIVLRGKKNNDFVFFELEDDGPGIPAEIHSQVFSPFFTYGKKRGTGLGLAIVKGIVEKMGGKVYFESYKGKTVFFIQIPQEENHEEE